ncbi:MAG: AAA family ATPase [Deltaproteobacteria bacterium]|nr:AAA family ATPase [Deltaproteobacteria bacterium]
MLNAHFGFSDSPFENNLDQRFLFLSQDHEEVLSALFFFIQQDKTFTLLCGDVGTGKTMLVHSFLEKLPSSVIPMMTSNPRFNYHEILLFIAGYLGIEDHSKSSLALADEIKEALVETRARGQKHVLIIDEAHLLSDENLEHIRLLSNIETSEKLLQILLVGQYELSHKLERPEMRQLRQRINISRFLSPLNPSETIRYIDFRLKVVRSSFDLIFEPSCKSLIYTLTNGVPRLINQVCDNALLVCKTEGRARVNKNILNKAYETLQSDILLSPKASKTQTGRFTKSLNPLVSLFVIITCIVILNYMGIKMYFKLFADKSAQTELTPTIKSKTPYYVRLPEPEPITMETKIIDEPKPRPMESEEDTLKESEHSMMVVDVDPSSETQEEVPREESIFQTFSSLDSKGIKKEAGYQEIVVEYGEHILRLADRYYGKNRYSAMKIILEANPEITDQDVIWAGQVLKLPILDPDDGITSENDEPIVPDIKVEDLPTDGNEKSSEPKPAYDRP